MIPLIWNGHKNQYLSPLFEYELIMLNRNTGRNHSKLPRAQITTTPETLDNTRTAFCSGEFS